MLRKGVHSMQTVKTEDLYKFEWPSSPTLAPDRQKIVYEKTIAREKTNDYVTHLHMVDLDSQEERVLVAEGTRNVHAIWSPDGQSIAYLSNRSHGTQLWLHSIHDDKETMLSYFKNGVTSIAFSPDGKSMYATVPFKKDMKVTTLDTEKSKARVENEMQEEQMGWKNGPKRYSELYYKMDGQGLHKDYKQALVKIDLATSAYEQLTDSDYSIQEFSISSDGSQIVFTSLGGQSNSPLFSGSLYTVSTSDGKVKELYSLSKASSPTFSPNGKWISFFADDVVHRQLLVIGSEGGEVDCLSAPYPDTLADLSFTDMRYIQTAAKPKWSKDGRFIYTLSTYQGTNEIVRFSLAKDTDPTTVMGGKRTIFQFDYDGENTVVAAYSAPNHPGKIVAVELSEDQQVIRKLRAPHEAFSEEEEVFPTTENRLDCCNEEWLAERTIVEPETFHFQSVDDWFIQGFVLKPANYQAGKKYPVFLDIHGGPHSAHSYTYFHQLQVLSAQGFAVVYINPRGSSGFGKEFTVSVQGDYGGKDMQDILTGLNEAIKRYPFLDREKVAVNGISYGGFMTSWLVTQTNRFYAAISEGCISNWVSMYGTSDICPDFMDQEFLGQTDPETLWKHSPLAYVDKVETPVLIIHAEEDLRCPMEQAEQFYSHIKRQGKTTELLRFPNTSHALLQIGEPKNRIARLEAIVEWSKRYLPK